MELTKQDISGITACKSMAAQVLNNAAELQRIVEGLRLRQQLEPNKGKWLVIAKDIKLWLIRIAVGEGLAAGISADAEARFTAAYQRANAPPCITPPQPPMYPQVVQAVQAPPQ